MMDTGTIIDLVRHVNAIYVISKASDTPVRRHEVCRQNVPTDNPRLLIAIKKWYNCGGVNTHVSVQGGQDISSHRT